MKGLRVTIAGTMGLVALAAAGLAALRHPSPLAASAIFSVIVAMIFAAWVAAICFRGRARAIWASFALCGTGYVYLASDSREGGPFGPLLSTPVIEIAHERLTGKSHSAAVRVDSAGQFAGPASALDRWVSSEKVLDGYNQMLRDRAYEATVQTAHAIFVLAAASAGGLLALVLTRTSHPRTTDHP
jgi:hypothetical protein